jgi:hypothetical protein
MRKSTCVTECHGNHDERHYQKENGRNPYGDEMVRAAGTATIGGPSISQEVNINIHGVSDPKKPQTSIAGKQQGIMSNGIQQLTTGPR